MNIASSSITGVAGMDGWRRAAGTDRRGEPLPSRTVPSPDPSGLADAPPWGILLLSADPALWEAARAGLEWLRFADREVHLFGAGSLVDAETRLRAEGGVGVLWLDSALLGPHDADGWAQMARLCQDLAARHPRVLLLVGEAEGVEAWPSPPIPGLHGIHRKADLTPPLLRGLACSDFRSHGEVAHLNRERCEALRLSDASRQASEAKSAFLANMSHELRSPMNAVIGFSRRLQAHLRDSGLEEPLKGRLLEYLDFSLASSRRLMRLLNDILDISRLESGVMTFRREPVDLAEVVRFVRQEVHGALAERRLDLAFHPETDLPPVLLDRGRIIQVLINLVHNAIRFSPPEGRIVIGCAIVPPPSPDEGTAHGPEMELRVADCGPGLPEAAQAAVFDKFYQADQPRGLRKKGIGLGLAICREIVQRHGGRIHAENRPGGGACFVIRLPALPLETGEGEKPT